MIRKERRQGSLGVGQYRMRFHWRNELGVELEKVREMKTRDPPTRDSECATLLLRLSNSVSVVRL